MASWPDVDSLHDKHFMVKHGKRLSFPVSARWLRMIARNSAETQMKLIKNSLIALTKHFSAPMV